MSSTHVSVMKSQALEALQVEPNQWYLDATFGAGGHTAAILAAGGRVVAFEIDQEAFASGHERFAHELESGTLILVRENFNKLQTVITQLQAQNKVGALAGILFDFGTSTDQLTSSDRGFSFAGEGELDMRMDDRLGVTAKDLLAIVPENQLAQLFAEFGGEQDARKIAKAIKRSPQPITRVEELATLIERVKGGRHGKLHPATKVFQALRIAVNSELSSIQEALPQALAVLTPGAHIVTIAFHEGEDRIAKKQFATWEEQNLGTASKKALVPTETEVQSNPRSRSAKLRVFRKS